jgi:hypothetical protein
MNQNSAWLISSGPPLRLQGPVWRSLASGPTLRFNDPQVPFDLGCEPGAQTPTVTPFNGEQHAGIQVLNPVR